MYEIYRNGLLFAVCGLVCTSIAQKRWAWVVFPLLVGAFAGLAGALDILRLAWLPESLRLDAPWIGAGILAIWSAQARAGWLRARSWPVVVIASAIAGDHLVAIGLAAAEPDAGRRARLVLAASGASLIGVTSGAAPLQLGWGGWPTVALGVILAMIGFVRGGSSTERSVPDLRAAAKALIVPLFGAVLVWLLILGNTAEILAQGLEALPTSFPGRESAIVLLSCAGASAVGDEGILAMLAHEVQVRALSLRGDWAVDAMRAGLAVGGGLPLLLMTRSRLRTGVPLWLLQVVCAVVWSLWRSS